MAVHSVDQSQTFVLVTVLCLMAPHFGVAIEINDIRSYLSEDSGEPQPVWYGLANQVAHAGKLFTLQIPQEAFRGNVSHYKVSEVGKFSLPSWLRYDSSTQTLEGVPSQTDIGSFSLQVVAEDTENNDAQSIAKYTFTINVQEDSSYSKEGAVPLSQSHIGGLKVIKCAHEMPVTMATVIMDIDLSEMNPKQKAQIMRSMCNHLEMPVEIIRLVPVGNKPVFDSSALVAGPGDVKKQEKNGAMIQWDVGCGNVHAQQMQILQQVETTSADGKMGQALGHGVVGWHVTNNRPHKVHRMKRQAIRPTPTLLPTVGPPTARPVVTRVIDIGQGGPDVPITRAVPSMSSPIHPTHIIATATSHHHKHRTKTWGRHAPHTTKPSHHRHHENTKYMTATLTPTAGPVKPTRVVDITSTMVIDSSMYRSPIEVPEPTKGVSRTETIVEPSVFATPTMDMTKTQILPTHTITPPLQTSTYMPTTKTVTEPKTTKEPTKGPTKTPKTPKTKTSKPTKPTRKPRPQEPSANFPPSRSNTIKRLEVYIGDVLNYQVPEDTFTDEDGNTRNLTLKLSDLHGDSLEPVSWVKLNATSQVIYGLPLPKDIGEHSYKLTAIDSRSEQADDPFEIWVKDNPIKPNHIIHVILEEELDKFKYNVDNLMSVVRKITAYLGDVDSQQFTITGLTRGSTRLSWTNKTISSDQEECPARDIDNLYSKIKPVNEGINPEFRRAMMPYVIKDVEFENKRKCIKETIEVKNNEDILITTIVPAVVIAAMLLLAAIIACILYRKKRKGKMSDEDQHTFIKKRIPIIFQDELEEKPCPPTKPLILDEEKPPCPPPVYHRSGTNSILSTPPSEHKEPIDTTEDEHDDLDATSPLYPPPPPLSTESHRRSRPLAQTPYRSPPPYSYVPP